MDTFIVKSKTSHRISYKGVVITKENAKELYEAIANVTQDSPLACKTPITEVDMETSPIKLSFTSAGGQYKGIAGQVLMMPENGNWFICNMDIVMMDYDVIDEKHQQKMKVKIKELLIPQEDMTAEMMEVDGRKRIYPQFHMDFIAEECIERRDTETRVLVIIRYKGELWGFEDCVTTPEGERWINTFPNPMEKEIEIFKVDRITVTKYVKRYDYFQR